MITVTSPTAYWSAVGIGVLLIAGAIANARRSRDAGVRVLVVIGVVLLGDFASYLADEISSASFSPRTSLPLALCDVMVLVAALGCLFLAPLACELTYFLGLAGSLQGLVTPDLSSAFPHLVFFEYLIGHLGVVAAALVIVFGIRIVPRPRAVRRSFFAAATYTGIVGIVDWSSGANYMFLRRPPGEWTLLRLLGPFPYYLLGATAFAVVVFLLLDAPFARRRIREAAPPGPLYAPLMWILVVGVGVVVYPVMFLIGQPQHRWGLLVRACGLLRLAAGVPIEVRGAIPDPATSFVVCANHTSYLDGLVVVLALAPVGPVTFLVSAAVGRQLIAGRFLRRIGAHVVGEGSRSPSERVGVLAAELRANRLVAIFPEGSVAEGPIRRFHIGAFLLAVESATAVLPLGITGSSSVLRAGSKRPAPGTIRVAIGTPIEPAGNGFPAARELSGRVHDAITALTAPGEHAVSSPG